MSEVSEFFSDAPQAVGQGRGPQTGQEIDGKNGCEHPSHNYYLPNASNGTPKAPSMEGGPDPDFVLGPTTPVFACVDGSDTRDCTKAFMAVEPTLVRRFESYDKENNNELPSAGVNMEEGATAQSPHRDAEML